jgi:hypothetical protein
LPGKKRTLLCNIETGGAEGGRERGREGGRDREGKGGRDEAGMVVPLVDLLHTV